MVHLASMRKQGLKQTCSQVSLTESASMVMSWPIGDMHLPSFYSFKTAKNFMSPVGHAVAHMWQYKSHILGTSFVKSGTTIPKTCTTSVKKWNNLWQNLYHFSKKLYHFSKKLYHFSKNLYQFSKNLYQFSKNWYQFSKNLYHFS